MGDRGTLHVAVVAAAFVVALVGAGCTAAGSPSGRPGGSPSPSTAASTPDTSHPPATSAEPSPTVEVALGAAAELALGERAAITDTQVTFALLAASGPGAGCNDCPNQVRLEVQCPPDREVLDFAFSGGMEESALERARQQDACGVTFYVVEVHDGTAKVQVDRPA